MIPSLTGSLTNKKLWSLYGDVGQDGLFYISVKRYVGIVVPQPNWHKVYVVSFFGGGVAQCGLFIFIVKCNGGAVEGYVFKVVDIPA